MLTACVMIDFLAPYCTFRIEELQPRTIIDIGSWAGGSALLGFEFGHEDCGSDHVMVRLFFADFGGMLAPQSFEKVATGAC